MIRGYYFITDSKLSRVGNVRDVKAALSANVKVVQYREKNRSTIEMYNEALSLRKICKKINFLINDRIDIALAVDADGVHIGNDDVPFPVARKLLGKKKIIGVTAHNIDEALKAQRLGADYISISPIFATKTKADAGRPTGVELIRQIRKHIRIPIIAIGGITLFNAGKVIDAGADGLCAISAVVTKCDVKAEIEKFQALF
ncbi:MAG: thiamine phosphate synthase [Candidatus Omnitrophota bacterium]